MFHLNNPNISMMDNAQIDQTIKTAVHGSAHVRLNDKFELQPSAYYLMQGVQQEMVFGSLLRIDFTDQNSIGSRGIDILIGSHYRLGDAIIPSVTLNIANYQLCFSYDVNISDMKVASNNKGGLEICLRLLSKNPFTKPTHSLKRGDERI